MKPDVDTYHYFDSAGEGPPKPGELAVCGFVAPMLVREDRKFFTYCEVCLDWVMANCPKDKPTVFSPEIRRRYGRNSSD